MAIPCGLGFRLSQDDVQYFICENGALELLVIKSGRPHKSYDNEAAHRFQADEEVACTRHELYITINLSFEKSQQR